MIDRIQALLVEHDVPAWLLHDFRGRNTVALRILGIPPATHLTRTCFVLVPARGPVRRFVNPIDAWALRNVPGEETACGNWKQMDVALRKALHPFGRVAMEYVRGGAVPYVSMVDAGTLERVRAFGVDVVSSMALVQALVGTVSDTVYASHVRAADAVNAVIDAAFARIADAVRSEHTLTDYDVQQSMVEDFDRRNMHVGDPPTVSLNEQAAIPHFAPSESDRRIIRAGDTVLIDAWCKAHTPGAVWADFTEMGVVAEKPAATVQTLFDVVRSAREAAIAFIETRRADGASIEGWQVDDACRAVIAAAGYGDAFVHRTGHSIGTDLHDIGVNMDNFESHDTRPLMAGSLFSVEPGIYLAGEVGVRSEVDVYVHPDGSTRVTGARQARLRCLLED